MDIAVLGLSADPPHWGHLELSRTLCRRAGYQRVWWVITPQNPAKHAAAVGYGHRRELARLLAVGQGGWLEVSDFEAGMTVLDDNIRTFMLLQHLRRVFPEHAFTFVVGADNWADPHTGLHTWGNFRHLLEYAAFMVMPRVPWTGLVDGCEATRQLAGQRVPWVPGCPLPPGSWAAGPEVAAGVSSRHIRAELTETGASAGLLPSQLAYIRRNGLYEAVAA